MWIIWITLHYSLTLIKTTRYNFPLEAFWWYLFPLANIFFSHSLLLLLVGVLTFKSIRAPEFFWKLEFFKSIATIANFFRQSRKESNITLFCQKSYDSVMPSIHVHQPECKELDMVINTTQFQIWISHKQCNYYIFNLFWNNLKD